MQSERRVPKGDVSMQPLGKEKTYGMFRNLTMAVFPAGNLENKTQTEV